MSPRSTATGIGTRSTRAIRLCLAALALLLAAAPAQASVKTKVGEFGVPPGHGNGQLEHPDGVAVNRTGAGGVSPGDVYVVDGGDPTSGLDENNRIVEFSATGDFVRAWGIDVVASGPDDISSSAFEVCEAVEEDVCKAGSLSAAAGGMSKPQGIAIDQTTGTVYVIDADASLFFSNSRVNAYSAKGAFEGSFGWDVNASAPAEELQFCTTASGCKRGTRGGGAGQLARSSRSEAALDPSTGHLFLPEGSDLGGGGNARIQEFAPNLNGAGEVTGAEFVKAVGWDTVASGPDQSDELQRVRVRATAGKFKLKYETESTGELAFDAPAAESEEEPGGPESLEKALNSLPKLSAAGFTVTVAGGPGDATASAPYEVSFHSTPKGKNAAQLDKVKGSLSGGSGESSVTVTTYNDGGKGLEVCEAAQPADVCKAGLGGSGAGDHLGQLANVASLAVDGKGTLYAVDESGNFAAVGPSRVLTFTFPAPGEAEAGEFAPGLLTQESGSGSPNAVNPTDVAVDRDNDHVYVAKKEGTGFYKFLEFDGEENLLFASPPGSGLPVTSLNGGGLAIGNGERLYLADHEAGVIILGPPPPPSACCVAVDDVGSTTARFQGTVETAESPEPIPTAYHFEYSKNGIGWKSFPAEDVGVGDGSDGGTSNECPAVEAEVCEVSQEAFGLEPNSDYLVRLVASNGSAATSPAVAFTTKTAPPSVCCEVATDVSQETAKLTGLITPNNQPTTYRFQWGESTSYGNEAPGFEPFAGAGGEATKASVPIAGLKEGAAYHFRILATNPSGTTVGPDQEFTTLNAFGLPARAPEQVTPNDKRPVAMAASGFFRYQAAEDGNSVLYPLVNGLPDATAGGSAVQYLGQRGANGWAAPTQLTPPALVPPISVGFGSDNTGQASYSSAELSCNLIYSPEPLGEMTSLLEEAVDKGVSNFYRRNEDATYTLLSNVLPINYNVPNGYHVDWASTDCNRILFDTGYRLLPEAPLGNDGLYEWDNGTLRLAGILPDGSLAAGAVAGLGEIKKKAGNGVAFTNVNSLSEDGSKVFFTAISKEGGDKGNEAIFVRSDAAETVDASQSQTATADKGAHYAMATPDGSAVFFLANYGLAENGSSAGASSCDRFGATEGDGSGCDLYRYDTASEELIDLSADANPADAGGASVVGLLDTSDDGSRTYFAARGQLLPNRGRSELQNLAGAGSYNLYLSEESEGGERTLSYVGSIAAEETTQGVVSGNDLSFEFGHWVADATPDGSHLLFASKANLTGYSSGGAAEAYLYSTETGKTICLSCRADGQPSLGDAKTAPLRQIREGGFLSLTIVQHRPRAISDDGRHVFFTSPDVLAPGALAGTHNVYEWFSGQVYLLVAGEEGKKDFTELQDTTPSGKDVFLVTKAKLVPQDFDNTADLYDLRSPHVPGERVGPPPAEALAVPCDPLAGACREAPLPQPAQGPAPASESFSGPGNPALGKPPCKRKRCKHKKHHHHKNRDHNNRRAPR